MGVSLGILTACQPILKRQVPDAAVPEPLAVLPLANETTSLDGPELVRRLCRQALQARGIQLVDDERVDEKLKEAGVTEGGQLGALTPQRIGQAMEAEGLLYGTLLEFEDWTLGFYSRREVRARFRLVAAATGQTLWEHEGGYKDLDFALSAEEAKKKAKERLGRSVLEKTLQQHLVGETWHMLHRVFEDFPPKVGS